MIEHDIECKLADMIDNALSANGTVLGVKCVASRDRAIKEDPTISSVVAVACGFRNNDAFSLNMVRFNATIGVATRAELGGASDLHNRICECIASQLTYWHNNPTAFDQEFQVSGYVNGEMRMDGGTARMIDKDTTTYRENFNIALRGAIP